MNAIADAIGVDAFRRAPVTADIVLMSLEHGSGCTNLTSTSVIQDSKCKRLLPMFAF